MVTVRDRELKEIGELRTGLVNALASASVEERGVIHDRIDAINRKLSIRSTIERINYQ